MDTQGATQPLVSVVVVCYNKEAYIGAALESLRRQTWERVEVIIVDNGSSDGSPEVIARQSALLRERGYCVQVIRQANQGIAGGVHAGLSRVNGALCCMLDGDDRYEDGYISAMARALEDPAYDIAVCHYRFYKADGYTEPMATDDNAQASWQDARLFENYLLLRLRTAANKFMVRTEYMRRCGIPESYDGNHAATQEAPFLLPLLAGGGRLCAVPQALYQYLIYDGQASSMASIEQLAQHHRTEFSAVRAMISRLMPGDARRLLAIARLGEIKGLLGILRTYADDVFYQSTTTALLEFLCEHVRPAPQIPLQRLLELNPLPLIYAVEHLILGLENPFLSGTLPTSRIIVCGALGTAARFLLPSLRHTPVWQDVLLWDRGAQPGTTYRDKPVCPPQYERLTPTDTVMLLPSDPFVEASLRQIVLQYTKHVLRHHDVVNYLAAVHFSQVYDGMFSG